MDLQSIRPLTNSPQVNMRRVGIQCYQVPVVSNIK